MPVIAVLLFGGESPAKANVFASDIRVNGGTNAGVVLEAHQATISYILNEPASAEVTASILSGTNLVRSFHMNGGDPGTVRGTNSFIWDGLDDNGKRASEGFYGIRITAASLGYPNWTQISDDSNPGNKVYDPYGIAVNNNTNSLFYGRVFVGNAPRPDAAGQQIGIYKFNADGSPAAEGDFSNIYGFDGSMTSPWKMEVAADDQLYVEDWSSYGTIIAFDQLLSRYVTVLSASNWPTNAANDYAVLGGPGVSGSADGVQVWLADVNTTNTGTADSLGILRWSIGTNGMTAAGDQGTVVVAAGPSSDLCEAPWDVAIDKNGAIYTIQRLLDSTDPASRVMRFIPNGDGSVSSNADWKAGAGLPPITDTNGIVVGYPTNTFDNAYGIAVSADASLVAVAVRGFFRQNGGLVILDANSGVIVTNLNSGFDSSYIDVAWDKAGNVYGTQEELWRVFSPPGANQSTTVSQIGVQVLSTIIPPVLSSPEWMEQVFRFSLDGQSNVTYEIDASVDFTNWVTVATSCSSSTHRTVQLNPPDPATYYRVRVAP